MALIAQRNSRCLSTTSTLDIASIMIDIAVKNGESCTIARNGGWLELSDGLITLPFTRYSCTPSFAVIAEDAVQRWSRGKHGVATEGPNSP